MKKLTFFRTGLIVSTFFSIYSIWKHENSKFLFIFFASCFFIFIFAIFAYYQEKHEAERKLAEKIFDKKSQNIDTNIVEIIKSVVNLPKK